MRLLKMSGLSFIFLSSCLVFFSPYAFSASEGLTKKTIQSVVTANQDQIKACYDAAVLKVPGIAGKFRMEIKVGKSGKVESSKVKDSNLPISDLEVCVEGKVRKWTFVAPLSNQPRGFSYPFTFGQEIVSEKPASQPLPGSPQTANDAQTYKGKVFKKSNRAIEDPKIFQEMAKNPAIKAKADNCENYRVLIEKCDELADTDRVVCSAMIDALPKKPATTDWTMIDHPDAFRIVSGVYFLGYWHIACEHIKSL